MATVANIIGRARAVLNDPDGTRWPDSDLIDDINAAIRQILLVRPDANPVTSVITLAPGTRQTIPADGLRLMDVIRNMGQDGQTPGYAIKNMPRDLAEALSRTWHSSPGKAAIKAFVFDEKDPRTFYVYPAAHQTTPVNVEILYSAMPDAVNAGGSSPLTDVYDGPLMQWVLHLAFSRDMTSRTSQVRAAQYEARFYRSLGVKIKGDILVTPNNEPEVKIT